MNYFNKNKKYIFLCVFLCVSYNLYFIFLLPDARLLYLGYLDFLVAIVLLIFVTIDYIFYRKNKIHSFENREIVQHDVKILQKQLQEQFDVNCNLQDFITKWCHEIKLPLSACLLMVEKIEDIQLRKMLKEQLERMNQQLKAALLGCKIQSNLFDLQIEAVNLMECVKTSIHNNQFFLIGKNIELDIQVGKDIVYTDKTWMVYILDQLMSNSIKYAAKKPLLKIWSEKKENVMELFVEDNGEGIKESDIRRIFEKGFTGSSYHNGKYKSTGMGLYMVAIIIEKLGYHIEVESEYQRFTRFIITIKDNQDYFFR